MKTNRSKKETKTPSSNTGSPPPPWGSQAHSGDLFEAVLLADKVACLDLYLQPLGVHRLGLSVSPTPGFLKLQVTCTPVQLLEVGAWAADMASHVNVCSPPSLRDFVTFLIAQDEADTASFSA